MSTAHSQVFLSHNSLDKPQVLEIKSWLGEQTPAVPCWIDSENLGSQDTWLQQLEQIIDNCRAAMVFYGPHGMGKVHEGERQLLVTRAFQRTNNFFLIPVLLPGATKEQVTGFTTLHNWVDFSQGLDNEAARQRLLAFARGEAPQSTLPEDQISTDIVPFRGLERFNSDHAKYFFGRDRDIGALCENLRKKTFVMVIGGSGSGKSSLVRAGLHTELAKRSWPKLDQTIQIPVLPGSYPLRKLAEAMVKASARVSNTPPDQILPSIDYHEKRFHERENGDGLLTALNSLFPHEQQHVVLVIDQFEELFTHAVPRDAPSGQPQEPLSRESRRFIDQLIAVASSRETRFKIVATLRADFLEPCLAHAQLGKLVSENNLILSALTSDDIRHTIVKPIQESGAYLEAGLVERILNDVLGQAAPLPLLQHALLELWSQRQGRWLRNQTYSDIGGVPGALQKRADATLLDLTKSRQQIAKNIFLRLVTLGEGVPDTRQRIPLSDLLTFDPEENQEVTSVIDQLQGKDARLIYVDKESRGDSTVEVTHEALIQNWEQFRGWLTDERDNVRVRQRLTDAAREWKRSQSSASGTGDPGLLWEGTRLKTIVEFADVKVGKLSLDEEAFVRASVEKLVHRLTTIRLENASSYIAELQPYRARAKERLLELRGDFNSQSTAALLASLALLPGDAEQVSYLINHVLQGKLEAISLIATALQDHTEQVCGILWPIMEGESHSVADAQRRFCASVMLAQFDPPQSSDVQERWHRQAIDIATQLIEAVTLNPSIYANVVELLAPIRAVLQEPLAALARLASDSLRQSWATKLTAEMAVDDAQLLVGLACDGTADQHATLFEPLRTLGEAAVTELQQLLQKETQGKGSLSERVDHAKRQAKAAATLLRLDRSEAVWPLWRHSANPTRRSYLIHSVGPFGVDRRALYERLRSETDVSSRRALILALGEMITPDAPAGIRMIEDTFPFLERLWQVDPDPGIHGAAEWTLKRWQKRDRLLATNKPLPSISAVEKPRQWRMNAIGQTLVLIPEPPPFEMGSPTDEEGRAGGSKGRTEERHRRRIGRSFAVSTHPITVSQFQRFRPEHSYNEDVSPGPDYPINTITWYDAVAYCNWLSEQDGIPRDQWCYDPDGEFTEGMEVPEDFLTRLGYRLLTEPEWEYACRAGTQSSYYFGEGEELLKHYAWYTKTSNDKKTLEVGTLKPNDLGLFDLSGNVLEWCHDWAMLYPTEETADEIPDAPVAKRLDDRETRMLRGGSYTHSASGVRSAFRVNIRPDYRSIYFGIRVARTYR